MEFALPCFVDRGGFARSSRSAARAARAILVLLGCVFLTSFAACKKTDEDRLEEVRELQANSEMVASIPILIDLIESGNRKAEVLYRYGRALSLTGKRDRSVWALDSARDDPDWFVAASQQLALDASDTGNYEFAIDVFRRLHDETPEALDEDLFALLLEARVLINSQENFEEALELVDVEGPNPYRWQDLTTDEIFKGKNIVLFALPGAFTPTCSTTHAPGYEEKYEEFTGLGVDQIVCLSVNDAYVMYNWKKNLDIEKVFMLPDGNGDFTRAMGMLVKKNDVGFGDRSWRYSMHVVDGVIKKMFIEEGKSDNYGPDPFEISDAETMLTYLKG